MRALTKEGLTNFDNAYRETVTRLATRRRHSYIQHRGELYDSLCVKTGPLPCIKFVGIFDTVKPTGDKFSHDIRFLSSIQHLRHALALTENRFYLSPEVMEPVLDSLSMANRSFVQAWFLGAHDDMGGGNRDDGLSLYPLQWILLESHRQGLALEHAPPSAIRGIVDDPLRLAFPIEPVSEGSTLSNASATWKISYENGLEVEMQDIRQSHQFRNPKDSSLEGDKSTYEIRMNWAITTMDHPRKPFKGKDLKGYRGSGELHVEPKRFDSDS